MANELNRLRVFVKGLGNAEVLELYPTPGTAFASVGFLQMASINSRPEMVEVLNDRGDFIEHLPSGRKVRMHLDLEQTAADEINLVANAGEKEYALRYHGRAGSGIYQYWLVRRGKLVPAVALDFGPALRLLPLDVTGLYPVDEGSEYEWFLLERDNEILQAGLALWVDARELRTLDTVNLRDFSGFVRDGLIYPVLDVATVWNDTAAPYFLRLDGTDDYVDFGDILDDDASGDFMIEAWTRVQGADGTIQEILSKRSGMTNEAGFHFIRNASNVIEFEIGSGSAAAGAVSAATLLQNVWKHVAVTVDRNGNAQVYVNAVASGSPVSVAAIGTGTNAVSLYLGRLGSAYGQVDLGGVRVYRWAAGGLPSGIATNIANHYDAERDYYGV